MAKGVSLQQVSQIIGQAIKKGGGKASVAQVVTKEGIGIAKTISTELFSFDFITLGLKLFVYFTVALIFAKFMEAVIFGQGIWIQLGRLLGFNIPKAAEIPEPLRKLFDQGISGFKYWDIIKIIAIILVIAEFVRYLESNKSSGRKSSPITMGIFVLIIIALSITTLPELFKRLKVTDFNLESLK